MNRVKKKNQFFRPVFLNFELVNAGLTPLTDFYKRVHILLKKHVSDCQKKMSFVQIIPLRVTFLTLGDIKSYY